MTNHAKSVWLHAIAIVAKARNKCAPGERFEALNLVMGDLEDARRRDQLVMPDFPAVCPDCGQHCETHNGESDCAALQPGEAQEDDRTAALRRVRQIALQSETAPLSMCEIIKRVDIALGEETPLPDWFFAAIKDAPPATQPEEFDTCTRGPCTLRPAAQVTVAEAADPWTVQARLQRVIDASDAGRNGNGETCTVAVSLIRAALAALQPGEAQGADYHSLLAAVLRSRGKSNTLHDIMRAADMLDAAPPAAQFLSTEDGEFNGNVTDEPAAQVTVADTIAALKAMPTRTEALGGQDFKYIQLGEALDTLRALAGDGRRRQMKALIVGGPNRGQVVDTTYEAERECVRSFGVEFGDKEFHFIVGADVPNPHEYVMRELCRAYEYLMKGETHRQHVKKNGKL